MSAKDRLDDECPHCLRAEQSEIDAIKRALEAERERDALRALLETQEKITEETERDRDDALLDRLVMERERDEARAVSRDHVAAIDVQQRIIAALIEAGEELSDEVAAAEGSGSFEHRKREKLQKWERAKGGAK